ncbi:MAG: NAD(P)H-hydrate dehydratase [Eubacterium sp.]
MQYLFTAKQAKQLDEHAIKEVGFPGTVLMEKAAMVLCSVICQSIRKEEGVLFVCGCGNNGGDAVAAARILKQQGYHTAIVLVGETAKMSEDLFLQLRLAAACDVEAVSSEAIDLAEYPILVDGLFGVGLNRSVEGVYQTMIELMNRSGKRIFAIDIPSGIHGDTGKVLGTAIKAETTVTFGVNKLGLVLYPGCEYAGKVVIGDIGYPVCSYEAIGDSAYYYEKEDLKKCFPERRPDGHKGTFGHVLVIGGSENMCGAAVFAATTAYRMGAGLVKVLSVKENRQAIQTLLPEALFDSYEEDSALEQGLAFADVIILGPGLGISEETKKLIQYVLVHSDKPLILDGDGITMCTKEQLQTARVPWIITPHPKELCSISGWNMTELKEDFLHKVKQFAMEQGGVVVGKDARTCVSNGTECYVNISGNNGMATGGSGDVLAGAVGGLVAQGMSCFEAAKAAVYLHGLAGDRYKEKYGEYTMLARDLIDSLQNIHQNGD